MKSFKLFLYLIFFAMVVTAFSCRGRDGGASDKPGFEASAVEISIGGMTCTGCEQTIQSGIMKLEGVESVKATFTDGRAVVVFDPAKTDTLKMKEAVLSKGYTVNKFTEVALQGTVN